MRALILILALGACSPKTEEPPRPAAQTRHDVILFLGDSLTAGQGVAMEDAFPALLDKRWQKEGRALRSRNAGVSGATTAGVLDNLDWSLADDVKIAFICIGANDGLRGMDLKATRKNIAAILEKTKDKKIKTLLAGMKIPPNYGQAYSKEFADIYPDLARRHKIKFLPFLLQDVAGRPDMNQSDGIHPNEAGHRRIADNVHAFLAKEKIIK